MRKIVLAVLLFWSGLVTAQIGNFPALVGQRGLTTPTACTLGQLFFDTDATAGSNIYGCTTGGNPGTWTLMGASFTPGTTVLSLCTANSIVYVDGSKVVTCDAKGAISSTAGGGLTITAGTAASAVSSVVVTGTRNFSGSATDFEKHSYIITASHASDQLLAYYADAVGGTTFQFGLKKLAANNWYVDTKTGYYLADGANGFLVVAGLKLINTGSLLWADSGNANTSTDTVVSRIAAGVVGVGLTAAGQVTGTMAATNYRVAANPVISGTAPTVASGGCLTGAGTVITNSNGTAAWTTTLGTGCSGSQPIVFTLPAATVGWICWGRNVSNAASSIPRQSGAVSTTSVTITNYAATTGLAAAWTDSDVVVIGCHGG